MTLTATGPIDGKMADIDLNEESSKFARHYLSTKWGGIADLVRKHDILNTAGHSFFAGVRFAEARLLKENTNGGGDQATVGRESDLAAEAVPANNAQ